MKEELSFNEQVNYALILNELKKLTPEKREELMGTLTSDLESYNVYLKMDKIANLIDAYFNPTDDSIMAIKPEYIEELIASLPDYHLLHMEDKRVTEIYNNYCSKLYDFMLYENFIDRKDLFKKYEVRSIVVEEAIKELKGMEPNLNMPNEIYVLVRTLKRNPNPNISSDVLNYLYAVKNGSSIVEYNAELETQKNKKLDLEGTLKGDKEDISYMRRKLYKAIGITSIIPLIIFGGSYAKIYKEKAEEGKGKMQRIELEATEEKNIKSVASNSYLADDLLSRFMDTKRTLVTVFGDTVGETVEVKVYDYTDTSFSTEELKNIGLDESKLIYSKFLNVEELDSSRKSIGRVYGEYTGVAHRDISTVRFVDYGEPSFINKNGTALAGATVSTFLICLLLCILSIALLQYCPLDQISEIKDLILLVGNRKDVYKWDLEKYEDVLNKIKNIQTRIDLEKKKQEILGQTTVDKELGDNRPAGFRI